MAVRTLDRLPDVSVILNYFLGNHKFNSHTMWQCLHIDRHVSRCVDKLFGLSDRVAHSNDRGFSSNAYCMPIVSNYRADVYTIINVPYSMMFFYHSTYPVICKYRNCHINHASSIGISVLETMPTAFVFVRTPPETTHC